MNEIHKNFLNEFHELLQKYNINAIYISYHSGDKRDYRITLCSNEQKLEFSRYDNIYANKCFADVGTYDGDYEVKE